VGKRKRPGRRCGLSPAHLPGLLEWTGPPLVDGRALAFVSTCLHRPSRLAAWRAMPLFGLDTGFPASNPRHHFTLTRLPEPSVLVSYGTDVAESSWGGHSSFGSSTTTPLRAPRPKATWRSVPEGVERARLLRRTIRWLRVAPCPPNAPAGLRFPYHPKVKRARSDPTTAPVARDVRRLVVVVVLPRESVNPVRGGREHCPCSDSALASWAVGVGPKPHPHRPGRRALSGTNISKDVA